MLKFITLIGGKFVIAGYLVNCNGHPFKHIRGAVCRGRGTKTMTFKQENRHENTENRGKQTITENGENRRTRRTQRTGELSERKNTDNSEP